MGIIVLALAVPAAAQTPQQLYGDPLQLFGVAGFQLKDKRPVNRCGQPANPRVGLADLNGDGNKEALIVDAGSCYAPDATYFAIATRPAAGQPWRLIFSHTGTVKPLTTRTAGWFDLSYTSAGKTLTVRYAGDHYGAPSATVPPPAQPGVAANAPLTPLSLKSLTAADRAAIFTAARAKRIGANWRMCEEEPSGSPATIEKIEDINGDGRPEALVTESGTFCWGRDEAGFALVSRGADGRWSRIEGGSGIAEFKPPKGLGGWPDLEVGGPGFCFPVSRWNGKEYVLHHFNEYMKGNCAANNLKPAVRAY